MRKKENVKAVMWILAIILIPAFVLWGGGAMLRGGSQGIAGKVFNQKVSLEEYLRNWEAVRNQALLLYGRFFEQIVQYLDLDNQAWDRIILLKEAKRQKIKIKDEELIERLRNLPLFQKEGKFDPQVYDWVLKYYLRTNPLRFEEEMRDSLRISKLVDKIYNQTELTEKELQEEYVREKELAKFSYFIIETKDFLNEVEIKKDDELLDYYHLHRENLRKPETVKVEYIFIDPKELEKEITISEAEIETYFTAHKQEFTPSPQPSPTPGETPLPGSESILTEEIKNGIRNRLINEKVNDKVEEIKNELLGELTPQANLKELAEKYKVLFKETDYFSLDTPLPEIGFNLKFYNYAFQLKEGEISEPIESQGGYIFLKVKERKSAYIPEFKEVKAKVEELLKKEKAEKLAQEKAERILKEVGEKKWEEIGEGFQLQPTTTELISREGYLPGIGKSEEFMRIGFSLQPQQIAPQPVKTERGFVILRLEEKTSINEEEFEKEKDDFRKKILAKKQQEQFETWFGELKKRAHLVSHLEKLQLKLGR
ncbi:MAG: SurA N-terminal domain-containing protein [Candidatus Omnitrophica bacterium]|nr:SurA N-terminal domain-containing protein [Candidatus Omnitrophota bacterium]